MTVLNGADEGARGCAKPRNPDPPIMTRDESWAPEPTTSLLQASAGEGGPLLPPDAVNIWGAVTSRTVRVGAQNLNLRFSFLPFFSPPALLLSPTSC